MSQGVHNSCMEGFIKIVKPDEDNKPLTSCITPDMVERFNELGWEVVSPSSSVLAIISAKVTSIAEEVTKDAQTASSILGELKDKIFGEEKEQSSPQE